MNPNSVGISGRAIKAAIKLAPCYYHPSLRNDLFFIVFLHLLVTSITSVFIFSLDHHSSWPSHPHVVHCITSYLHYHYSHHELSGILVFLEAFANAKELLTAQSLMTYAALRGWFGQCRSFCDLVLVLVKLVIKSFESNQPNQAHCTGTWKISEAFVMWAWFTFSAHDVPAVFRPCVPWLYINDGMRRSVRVFHEILGWPLSPGSFHRAIGLFEPSTLGAGNQDTSLQPTGYFPLMLSGKYSFTP